MTLQTRTAVAQVVDTLELGGKERVAVTLANELAARGYESHLICTRAFGPLRSSVSPDVHAWSAERSWRGDLAGLRRLARHFDACHIALAHTHNEGASYLVRLARLLAAHPPLQVVHDHRGHILDSLKHVWLDRLFLSGVDGFIAVSEQLHSRAARLLGLPPQRCRLVPNGIELPALTPYSDGPPTVVQVANLQEPKGHRTAIRAAARLRERIPELRWICVGRVREGSPYVTEVRRLIREADLSDCVELAGASSDVASYLRRAQVGVLTSDAEGLPLALIEYLGAGLPVVTTEVGEGPRLIAEAGAGHVVPRGDPDAVADAVYQLLSDRSAARTRGEAGRRYATRNFSSEAMVAGVEALYREVLPPRG